MLLNGTQLFGLIIIILDILSSNILVQSQYNGCLMKPGCRDDECCYSVVMNFNENCYKMPACAKSFKADCCYNSRVVQLDHGRVYGFAQLLDDPYGYRDNGNRFLQMFLGVRYAKAPVNDLRFKKPEPLDRSNDLIDATELGASCPQSKKHLRGLTNPLISEDCLNMNIYVVNDTRTIQSKKRKYPIMVFFHGGEHKYGSANLYPGHILAQQDIMVITVNYRLGPFGFLSTEDDNARGNYGLWDQLAALRFIKRYGDRFQGDVNKITLVGHGSGAGDVALHTMRLGSGAETPLLPIPEGERLFDRVMWLSGSDLMRGGFIKHRGESRRYAQELGVQVGCSNKDTKTLVECLSKASMDDMAEAGDVVSVHGDDDWNSIAWSPCIDGEFMGDFPLVLRQKKRFLRMRVIGGLTENAGSYIVQERYPNLLTSKSAFNISLQLKYLQDLAREDDSKNIEGTAYDLRFEYTNWLDSTNQTLRKREMTRLWTDRAIGAGLEASLKSCSDIIPLRNWTQMFVLKYTSSADSIGHLLGGAYHSTEVSMMFGLPYMNSTDLYKMIGLSPANHISRGIPAPTKTQKLDINMTNYMIYFTTNFVTSGNATPDVIRNLTWDTYRYNNRTYFLLDLHNEFENDFELYQNYRMYHYAYWQTYYSSLLKRSPRFTTPFPTPVYLEHLKISSFSLGGILAVLVILLFILVIVLVRKRKQLT